MNPWLFGVPPATFTQRHVFLTVMNFNFEQHNTLIYWRNMNFVSM